MLKLRIFIFFSLLIPAFASAQALPDPVQYMVAPESPGPGETVTIEAQGVGSFLGNAEVTWTRDNAVVQKGPGINRYTFTAPGLGQTTTIRITIDSPSEGTYSKTFSFTPSLVNLVWEADTTVPPFFQGKPLYTAGSPLRVVAFPNVTFGVNRIAASALSYQWSLNDEPVTDASGLGRSSFSFSGDQLKNGEDVSVDVFYGNKKVAAGDLFVPSVDPTLVLYQRDALRGVVYDQALPFNISLVGKEVTIKAEPFYFSTLSQKNGSLVYAWQLDSTETSGPDASAGVLTLRRSGEGGGSATLTVGVQNYDNDSFVQAAETTLQLVFGQPNSFLSNLFGL